MNGDNRHKMGADAPKSLPRELEVAVDDLNWQHVNIRDKLPGSV